MNHNRNLKNLGKRPKCPECGAKDPASRGNLSWQCIKCGRSFSKFTRRVKNKDSPNCEKCGADSQYVHSAGDRWKCTKCGRKTVKIHHSKRIDLGKRPSCPYCGADKPHSIGPCWRCRKCYRSWVKEHKREHKLSMLDFLKTPVHEI